MWNDQILSLLGNGNDKAINSTSSVWTRVRSLLFSSNPYSLPLSNRAPRDNREKKMKGCEVFFQRRFHERRRCRIVRSLLPILVIQKCCYHCKVTSQFCLFVSILFSFLHPCLLLHLMYYLYLFLTFWAVIFVSLSLVAVPPHWLKFDKFSDMAFFTIWLNCVYLASPYLPKENRSNLGVWETAHLPLP